MSAARPPEGARTAAAGEGTLDILPASPDEILRATRELMEVAARGEAPPAFDLRVAARLLDLLQREWALGEVARREERAGLRVLLPETDDAASDEALRARLCERIANAPRREGEEGAPDDEALHAHLWRTALARLAIDSPSYRWCEESGID